MLDCRGRWAWILAVTHNAVSNQEKCAGIANQQIYRSSSAGLGNQTNSAGITIQYMPLAMYQCTFN